MNFGVIMYQTSASKGQELVAQRMTKELASQGGNAVLITSRFHDFRPVISPDEVRRNGGYVRYEDSSLGIEVYRVESRKVDWPPRRIEFSNFISTIDRIAGELDLDVLITHSTLWNGPDLTAQFISWKRRVFAERGERRLVFCHMSHFQPPARQRYSLQEREWRRSWNEYVLKRIIRETDLLLVTTPMAERHMVELGASREQCLLFPGGIEVPRCLSPEELDGFRERHGIRSDERLVTFLGTIEERKNVSAILKVAKSLRGRRDLRLIVAGRPQGAYGRKIMSTARETPNVSILGEIRDEEKDTLIRASYLNLTMSKMEALGLTQLEFMSAGVPVVTSGVGGQSWVVKNGHTGIVLRGPHDTKRAASAIALVPFVGGGGQKGTWTPPASLPAGCKKPAGGYLIIADAEGFNGSKLVGSPAKPWPIINVTQGSTVDMVICNADASFAHGFQISHYFDSNIESVAPGQVITVSFAASSTGTFTIYCSILCESHVFMQGGRLNVSA